MAAHRRARARMSSAHHRGEPARPSLSVERLSLVDFRDGGPLSRLGRAVAWNISVTFRYKGER